MIKNQIIANLVVIITLFLSLSNNANCQDLAEINNKSYDFSLNKYSKFKIDHIGPKNFETTSGNHVVTARITGNFPLLSSFVTYNVDNGEFFRIPGKRINKEFYKYTIPAQACGAKVFYKIIAQSKNLDIDKMRLFSSENFAYVSGKHIRFDQGTIDKKISLNPKDAIAVKLLIPEGKIGNISSALLRAKIPFDKSKNNIKLCIWESKDGTPGKMIESIEVNGSALSEKTDDFTYFDLRNSSPKLNELSGEVFIGFSSDNKYWKTSTSTGSGVRSYIFKDSKWDLLKSDLNLRLVLYESDSNLSNELTSIFANKNSNSRVINWIKITNDEKHAFEIKGNSSEDKSKKATYNFIDFE